MSRTGPQPLDDLEGACMKGFTVVPRFIVGVTF